MFDENAKVETMHTIVKRVLFWTPRVLCILFAAFLSLFSLDVFGAGLGVGETVLALLLHLLPVFVVILVLIVAWGDLSGGPQPADGRRRRDRLPWRTSKPARTRESGGRLARLGSLR